jgi:16S rRNA (adenine1518-N6/adenine1519-N6)-dimethyltransferase
MVAQLLPDLKRHGIKLDRRAGQHIVIDSAILDRVVGYAELSSSDVVLEVGSGTGNLTTLLADRVKKVVSIERDVQLLKLAREAVKYRKNVEFIRGDATRVNFPRFDKVVANLPYGISSEITFKLLEHDFTLAVLMYQKEFAERLVAKPGSEAYSRLTVNLHYRAGAEILEEVPPEAFFPNPKVFSAVVRLKPRDPPFRVTDEKMFSSVVRALFQHRRQRVRNSLMRSFEQVFPGKKIPKAERRKIIDEKLLDELANSRVMDLEPEEFGLIADSLTFP